MDRVNQRRVRRISSAAAVFATALALIGPNAAEAKRNVYVTAAISNDITAFDVAGSGALTPLAGSPFATGSFPLGVVAGPDGKHLYVANAIANGISVYDIANDGSLSPLAGSPFASPGGPTGVAVSPDGKHLYVTSQLGDSVSVYDVANDGGLTPIAGSPFAAGNRPYGVTVSPDGKHLYVGNRNGGNISAYGIANDGSLTQLASSPYAAGATTLYGVTVSPDGNHLYAANFGTGKIFAFVIASGGTLTPVAGSPFTTASSPVGVAVAPDSQHLLVSNDGASAVSSYAIGSDGGLTEVAGSPFATATGPVSVVISPDGKHAYTANSTSNSVSGFDVAGDGTLGTIAGSPFAIGGTTPDFQSVTMSPNQPPVASFTATGLATGSPTAFDATASTDSDGTIARYAWDFGDGTTDADGGPTPSHAYATPGTYQATVTLTDDEGCSTTRVYAGQTVYCNGSAVATQTQAIKVTDGTAPQVTITAPADGATYKRNQVVNAAYTCAEEAGGSGMKSCAGDVGNGQPIDTSTAGTHTFTVTATDNAGNTTQKKVTYEVSDPPPVIEHLAVAPQSFASDPATTPLGKGGAKIKVTLSKDARVRFRVRHDPERANGGPEPAPHVFKRELKKGKNSVSFTATLGNRTFAPGKYQLIARARDDANQTSKRVTAKFQVTG